MKSGYKILWTANALKAISFSNDILNKITGGNKSDCHPGDDPVLVGDDSNSGGISIFG
ncbi:MAG: hypothetical protein IPJ13_26935 [Saprospiraceae bacterium]|jgi:hypothetical protein|nr:hypothetical protein [Saprospiraceae bacterium]MBK9565460.1 hypothetical protein [Saprospiraceae bacterium]